MNLAKFLLESRGPVNLAQRIPTLFTRFGLTDEKIKRRLDEFVAISQAHGVNPTLAVTANILERHPRLIKNLQLKGVEFAIHGLVHTDYSSLNLKEQIAHLEQAARIFEENGIDYSGFRCPYLRYNNDTLDAVDRLGFQWESSNVVAWDVLDGIDISPSQARAYERLIELYRARSCLETPVLPGRVGNFVEIPVSIPDDEAIVDRLGVTNPESIAAIWLNIFQKSHERGQLFTLQLHHERVPFLWTALDRVLSEARQMRPQAWLAQLKDIADWWLEREKVRISVSRCENSYLVKVNGSQRATVLIKNCLISSLDGDWPAGYRLVKNSEFLVPGNVKPCVGVGRGVAKSVTEFLRSEGFVVEESDDGRGYSVYLTSCSWERRDSALTVIDEAEGPLVRLWRWPGGTRSAVAVTGDIDSITLMDFASRIFEV